MSTRYAWVGINCYGSIQVVRAESLGNLGVLVVGRERKGDVTLFVGPLPAFDAECRLPLSPDGEMDDSDREKLGGAFDAIEKLIARERAYDVASSEGDLDTILAHVARGASRLLSDAVKIATHSCQWNEDDRCSVCGADGRA